MTIEELINQINKQAKELEELARRRLPIKVGNIAKRHYQENFRQGGFVNGGLKPWQKTKRQLGKGTDASRTPLMSGRKHLFSSIGYTPSDNKVRIHNDVPYAPTHNWGGVVHPNVTPKMRKFAWAQFYSSAGITKGDTPTEKKSKTATASKDALIWRNMALTKKKKLSIKIPKRQFLGESEELNTQIQQTIESEISKIINI